jgi:hypothetical protein
MVHNFFMALLGAVIGQQENGAISFSNSNPQQIHKGTTYPTPHETPQEVKDLCYYSPALALRRLRQDAVNQRHSPLFLSLENVAFL